LRHASTGGGEIPTPVTSAIPLTEKLLINAGGWPAMKAARDIVKAGRVTEARYEPPLLTGFVREGICLRARNR